MNENTINIKITKFNKNKYLCNVEYGILSKNNQTSKQRVMKKQSIAISILLILFSNSLFSQTYTLDFEITVNDNLVTFTNLSSCSCSGIIYPFVHLNFGDTTTGTINEKQLGNNSQTHYYNYPGTYTVRGILHANGTNCSCIDTIYKQVTITTIGVNCHADFCYHTYYNSNFQSCVDLINTSTSHDSIIFYTWEGPQGFIATNLYNPTMCYPSGYIINGATLTISTENSCESQITKFFISDYSDCDTIISTNIGHTESNNISVILINNGIEITQNDNVENYELVISDILGRVRKKVHINDKTTHISNTDIKEGVYIYILYKNNQIYKVGKFFNY